jgi:hypothetical protein
MDVGWPRREYQDVGRLGLTEGQNVVEDDMITKTA